ncbi:MAG: radical SAM protein [Thermodesulfobacteriota bacterium]
MRPIPDDDLASCRLCPRRCGVDRRRKRGFCGGGALAAVNLWQLHHGEEPVLSGGQGSGTIFFAGCSLRCVYCQNYRISQLGWGAERRPEELAAIMLELAAAGAHNVNLVTPSHFTPQVRAALQLARARGLTLPVVWNSSAYEEPATLSSLEGLVDIYLPDLRYAVVAAASRYSAAGDYPAVAQRAIREMHRQVGHLQLDDQGLARRGLLCRLLVLPGNVNRVDLALDWLADLLGPRTHVSLMAQYYPAHQAARFPEIDRPVTETEYHLVQRHLEALGLPGFVQDLGSRPQWTPDFRPQVGPASSLNPGHLPSLPTA